MRSRQKWRRCDIICIVLITVCISGPIGCIIGSTQVNCGCNLILHESSPVVVKNSVRVYFPRDLDDEERKITIESIRSHIELFEQKWGRKVRPVDLYLFRGSSIPMRRKGNKQYLGIHYGINGPIHAIIGKYYEVPALYHEFIHGEIGDSEHKHKMWKVWEAQLSELVGTIKQKRAKR